jgi:gliding motility-associated-like protein
MKKFILVSFLTVAFFSFSQAQILPPDFLCVKGDTLFWELPSNTCGPFISYDVYARKGTSGAFTLLVSVSDPAQTFHYHPNPGGEQWFYYIVSNHNCPGQTSLPSDTLDNRPPQVSPIRSVSVENGNVVVNWQPSPSPEVFAYVIYRQTPTGVVPIDTVMNATTYTDMAAMPGQQSESYFVNALDRCGNTSIFDLKHNSVFLKSTAVEPCKQTVSLSWNLYENWQGGIGEQQVLVSVNGASPSLYKTLFGMASTFVFENANDGDQYCFVIQAVETGTGTVARSNEICLTADVVQPVRDMFIQNVSVTPANEVEVTWVWNTNAEIKEVKILRSSQNAAYQPAATQNPPVTLPPVNTFTDNAASPGAGKVFYKIQTKDDCDTLANSTYGSTIFLTGTSQADNTNLLSWSALDIQNATPTGYEVFKILNGAETKIATLPASAASYSDPIDPTNIAEAGACYYVTGSADLSTPDGNQLAIRSRSNLACVEQAVRIFTPNAFVPDGFNQEFKPLIVLGDLASYEMRIFDRYGQELFVSENPDDGWNGKKGDREMPQGTYVFFIRVKQSSGRVSEKKGVVLLLR